MPYAIWFLEWEMVFALPIIWLSFWWMSLTDMCILLYAVRPCFRGVIFKQLAKWNLILNVPGELVIIRDRVINTSWKWNIPTYFPSCGFLYRYLKLGANIPAGTVKTTLCGTEAEACLKEKASWPSLRGPRITLAMALYSRAWPWNLQAQKFEFVSTARLDLRSMSYVHRTVVVNQNTNFIIATEQYCFHRK